MHQFWGVHHLLKTYSTRTYIRLPTIPSSPDHRWELLGNYPVFAMVMVSYYYVERIWRILVTPFFCITYNIVNKYYPGEPVDIHIKSLINIILENNRVITIKNGKGKLPIFFGNRERVIPIYATD